MFLLPLNLSILNLYWAQAYIKMKNVVEQEPALGCGDHSKHGLGYRFSGLGNRV